MLKRIVLGVLLGMILFGLGVHVWIWLDVRHDGLPPINEQVYQQLVASYRDG